MFSSSSKYIHTHTHTHTHIYIYREREREWDAEAKYGIISKTLFRQNNEKKNNAINLKFHD